MSRPLNILTLSTLFPNSTTPNFGIFVERQTAELESRSETQVSVVNPIGIPPWPFNRFGQYGPLNRLPKSEQWRGLRVHRPPFTLIPKYGGPQNPVRIAKAVLPLIKELHQNQAFDLIDAEFFYPDGPAAMQLSKELGVPYTIKARGADIHHWSSIDKCREHILMAADKASALLAVSRALKQDMIALGMDGDKIRVHYTGLDQDKFKPVDRAAMKKELDVDGPLFICTGALIPRKNQHLAIKAMTAFPEATLMLAGTGEEEGSYRQLVSSLGLTDRVRFLGNVPHEELPKLVAASDISILVSKSEGLANAWVEALACGTPIIISEAGGARELVRSDLSGRIVAQDSDEIVEAIHAIMEAPHSREDIRNTVSHFSWKNNGDQLLDIFKDVVREFRPEAERPQ